MPGLGVPPRPPKPAPRPPLAHELRAGLVQLDGLGERAGSRADLGQARRQVPGQGQQLLAHVVTLGMAWGCVRGGDAAPGGASPSAQCGHGQRARWGVTLRPPSSSHGEGGLVGTFDGTHGPSFEAKHGYRGGGKVGGTAGPRGLTVMPYCLQEAKKRSRSSAACSWHSSSRRAKSCCACWHRPICFLSEGTS